MNTYPIMDRDGRIFAFELESVYIGVKKIANILLSVQGVSNLRVRKLFGATTDIHIEFIYTEKDFIVWEPFADSSRYWIGPKAESQEHIDLETMERAFRTYQPRLVIKLLGDLVSFKFLSASRRGKRDVVD